MTGSAAGPTAARAAVGRTGTPVVVGVDDGPLPLGVLEHAVREAARRDTGVRVVHGHGPGSPPASWPEDAGGRACEHLRRALTTPVSRRCVLGDPVEALLAAAGPRTEIVLGDRHRRLGSPAGRTLGSVVDRAPCPVLVVGESLRPPEAEPERGVVAAVDASADGATVLRAALSRAELLGTGVTVVHTWQAPDDTSSTSATDALVQRVAGEHPAVPITVEVVEDRPGRALIDAARGAGLLVLGHRRPPPRALREPASTATVVLAAPPCPVLVLGPRVLDAAREGAGDRRGVRS